MGAGLSIFVSWNINVGHVYPSGRLVLILACEENGHKIAVLEHFRSSFNCFYWLRESNSLDQIQLWKYGLTEVESVSTLIRKQISVLIAESWNSIVKSEVMRCSCEQFVMLKPQQNINICSSIKEI